MTKPIVVCADDYSMSPEVSSAILSLLEKGSVSATSAMVLSPTWKSDASALRELGDAVDVGLHLDFTSDFAMCTPTGRGLGVLMLRSALRTLDSAKVREQIARQLDAFEDAWGDVPDHVDGHQHIHQFPVIREALLQECRQRYVQRRPWVRLSRPVGASSAVKGAVIACWGAQSLVRLAAQARLPVSGDLLGVYDFEATEGVYARRMKEWLQIARPADLLMCHPARERNAEDAINPARMQEYRYLASAQFADDLHSADCKLVRGSDVYCDFKRVQGVTA